MDQVNRFSVLCLSPEQVNEQDGDREQQKDSVEEQGDDHAGGAWLAISQEVPVELCRVPHGPVRAVGETLKQQKREGVDGAEEEEISIRRIRVDTCNMRQALCYWW